MILEKYLQEIGLSDKEATVYLALLAVDHASVLDLAKKTKINRTTIYFVLESLAKKGLVSEIQHGKKTLFAADPPERLENFIMHQQTTLEEHLKQLKSVLPKIKAVQRESGERPVLQYHEGKEGVLSSMEELYEEGDDHGISYLFFSRDHIDAVFHNAELKKLREIRRTKMIRAQALYTWTDQTMPSDELAERYRIDEKKYPISCDFSIYRDKVKINTLGRSIASITIQSQDVAESLRSLFLLAFEKAKNDAIR